MSITHGGVNARKVIGIFVVFTTSRVFAVIGVLDIIIVDAGFVVCHSGVSRAVGIVSSVMIAPTGRCYSFTAVIGVNALFVAFLAALFVAFLAAFFVASFLMEKPGKGIEFCIPDIVFASMQALEIQPVQHMQVRRRARSNGLESLDDRRQFGADFVQSTVEGFMSGNV